MYLKAKRFYKSKNWMNQQEI